MRASLRLLLRFSAAGLGLLLAGNAWAQYPQGVKSGVSPEASGALVTLAIPAVIGVNVGHNFVLDFNSGTKCWGSGSTQGTFPQAASGTTTYTFAVNAASVAASGVNVACPGAGSQTDLATVQVMSTMGTTSHLTAAISDGANGAQVTLFTGLIADVFTGNRLKLVIPSDGCGNAGGRTTPLSLSVAGGTQVAAIPKVGWTDCKQTLQLVLDSTTPVAAGTATGILTYTMINP